MSPTMINHHKVPDTLTPLKRCVQESISGYEQGTDTIGDRNYQPFQVQTSPDR